ncbi:hypothetical protein BX666DRAFT_2025449 [Dichotomocladium elegans]|nr:hypothetical protein BX666DRAFT_2025449 [Dichotomocladium elegans]
MEGIDVQNLMNEVRAFKEMDLSLFRLQKKFQEKTSLSTNGGAEELPYHPDAVRKELEDYKKYAEKLEDAFITREAQDRFLRLLLQDPPFDLTAEMKQSAERATEKLEQDILNTKIEATRLQNILSQRYRSVEETYQRLVDETDRITKLERELEQIEASTGSVEQLKRTREELLEKQEKLTNRLVEINMSIDEKRENIERTKQIAIQRQKQVDALEARVAALKADMPDVIKDNQRRNPAVEEATIWYRTVTDECNRWFGIEKITETPSAVHVRFMNSAHDELHIKFDETTRQIMDADTTGCDIRDIMVLAKSCHDLDQAITTIIRGTLSKLRP